MARNRRNVLLVLPVLAIVFGALFVVAGSISKKNEHKSTAKGVLQASYNLPKFNIGVTKTVIGNIDQVTQTKRVSTTFYLKNNTNNILQISPGLQLLLNDATGKNYKVTAKYLKPGQVIGGPLVQGASRTEAVDFDIPANVKPVSLTFQIDATYSPITMELRY